jgi:hypothetical protein
LRVEFWTEGFEDITLAHEVEESPLFESVARERLMKIYHSGRRFSGCSDDL